MCFFSFRYCTIFGILLFFHHPIDMSQAFLQFKWISQFCGGWGEKRESPTPDAPMHGP